MSGILTILQHLRDNAPLCKVIFYMHHIKKLIIQHLVPVFREVLCQIVHKETMNHRRDDNAPYTIYV